VVVPAGDDRASLLHVAQESTARWVVWFDDRDELAPNALADLTHTAGAAGSAGAAIGRYVFWSRLGVIPGDPLSGVPESVSLPDWRRCCLAPSHTILAPRAHILSALRHVSPTDAWEYHLWLSMADAGVTFRLTPRTVGAFTLRDAGGSCDAPALQRAALSLAHGASDRDVSAWIDAAILDRTARAWVAECGESVLAHETLHPEMFARWWQRLSFLGVPPAHVLRDFGGPSHAFGRVPPWRAKAMADLIDSGQPVVVWGLGRNAAFVAAELDRRSIRWHGVDDALRGQPTWAKAPIQRMDAQAALRLDAAHLVTPLNDASLVARLTGRDPIRWNDTPDSLLAHTRRQMLAECHASAMAWRFATRAAAGSAA